jgi:putative addiction module component (TIGR02574 family)
MLPNALAELLKLSARDRIEIVMTLWESLSETERAAQFALTPEQKAELDHRLAEHIANPASAVAWDEVRRKLVRPPHPALSPTGGEGGAGS